MARKQFRPLELGLNLLLRIAAQARNRTQRFRCRRVKTHQHLGAGHQKVGVKHRGIRLLPLEHHAVLLNGFGCLLDGALGLDFAGRARLHFCPVVHRNQLRKIVLLRLLRQRQRFRVGHLTVVQRIKSSRNLVVATVQPTVFFAAATRQGYGRDRSTQSKGAEQQRRTHNEVNAESPKLGRSGGCVSDSLPLKL